MPDTLPRPRALSLTALLAGLPAALAAPAAGAQGSECLPFQQPKLTASDAAPGDRFGIAVSVHGDAALVGAYLHNAAGPSSGAAYVFQRTPSGAFAQSAKLVAQDAAPGAWFGVSVSIQPGLALVGAQLDNNANGQDAGAAYVFSRQAGVWQQEAKLIAPDGAPSDWLGHSVSLRGNLAVVGAHLHDQGANDAGAAYVFRRSGTGQWAFEAKLLASDPEAGAEFGTSVSTDGTTIAVGARLKNDAGNNAGAAYVFRQAGGSWQQEAKLAPQGLSAGDEFGFEVAVDGDHVAASARLDDDVGLNAGAVYVFTRDALGAWPQVAKLTGSDQGANDRLGEGLGLFGELIVAGARQHAGVAPDGGAAYVFARQVDGTWSETAKLVGSDVGVFHFYGIAAAVHAGRVVVGANLDPQFGAQAGAAYVHDLYCAAPPALWQPAGSGIAGAGGEPRLHGAGELLPGAATTLVLADAPANTFLAWVLGAARIDLPLFAGVLVPSPDVVLYAATNPLGAALLPLPLAAPLPPGLQLWAQGWLLDPSAPQGIAATQGRTQTAP